VKGRVGVGFWELESERGNVGEGRAVVRCRRRESRRRRGACIVVWFWGIEDCVR